MLGNRSTMDPPAPHSAPGKLVFFFFLSSLCQAKHSHKISFANNPNFPTWETEAGGSEDITQLWLYRKFQASQGYIRSCRGGGRGEGSGAGGDDHTITIKQVDDMTVRIHVQPWALGTFNMPVGKTVLVPFQR